MLDVKKINYGLILVTAIFTGGVNADSLNGKYACLYKAMDIEFELEFDSQNKYKQDMEFVGIENGNYSINGEIITFTPTEMIRGGKKKDVPSFYKRNIISSNGNELIMTNLNDSDQFVCNK